MDRGRAAFFSPTNYTKQVRAGDLATKPLCGNVAPAHQLAGEALEDIARRDGEIAERYQRLFEALGQQVEARYGKLGHRFARHLEPVRDELLGVQEQVSEELENLEVELPDVPEGETDEDDSRVWLLDPSRDYVQQTEHFRRVLGVDAD